VLIDARLRHETGWSDARILNISRRGLMARAPRAPQRGSYIEICRGTHRIVACVVWARDGTFGARAQDMIAVEAIAKGADAPPAANSNDDRRQMPRTPSPQSQHERSRRRARGLEFAAIVLFAASAAFLVFDTVRETLSRPLAMVEATLAQER